MSDLIVHQFENMIINVFGMHFDFIILHVSTIMEVPLLRLQIGPCLKCKQRLLKTHIHIMNKQKPSFLTTTIIHELHFISTTTICNLPWPFDHPSYDYNMAMPHHKPKRQNNEDGQWWQWEHTVLTGWRQFGMSMDMPCHPKSDKAKSLSLSTWIQVSSLTPFPLSFIHTQEAVAMSLSAMWQPQMDERRQQQHVMNGGKWAGKYNHTSPPLPLLFSQAAATWQATMAMDIISCRQCGTSSRWWRCMLLSLLTLFEVSNIITLPLSFFHMRSRGCVNMAINIHGRWVVSWCPSPFPLFHMRDRATLPLGTYTCHPSPQQSTMITTTTWGCDHAITMCFNCNVLCS